MKAIRDTYFSNMWSAITEGTGGDIKEKEEGEIQRKRGIFEILGMRGMPPPCSYLSGKPSLPLLKKGNFWKFSFRRTILDIFLFRGKVIFRSYELFFYINFENYDDMMSTSTRDRKHFENIFWILNHLVMTFGQQIDSVIIDIVMGNSFLKIFYLIWRSRSTSKPFLIYQTTAINQKLIMMISKFFTIFCALRQSNIQ